MSKTVWRGQTMDDRSAERRQQLLDVCLELVGSGGAAVVTLRGVCRTAKLSPRYFYENFSSREDLLIATYDHVEAELFERLVRAGQGHRTLSIRTVLETCAEYFEEDPRRARILLREPMSDETLRAHQSGKAPVFIASVIPALESADRREAPRDAQELGVLAASLSGALIFLYLEWLDGRLDIERDALADSATRLVTAIARASRREP
ncbi:TetR/AcrR family transcriptional regulator [Mycolicibacterium chubuense]|uniref:TetR/AcrR family transcriptional regulator n=1 Tax=Mycolicibacterium chubuense TaxID=1800 RepID=UPI001F386559|nr:TetR/AcrR family transcriptional regulator [Mycolicibacterium chubuense]